MESTGGGLKKAFCIVLLGKSGAGKDHVASECEGILSGWQVTSDNLKFSRILKLVCSLVWGWDHKEMDKNSAYKEEVSPELMRFGWTRRQVLQMVGTDVFRENFGEDVWINAAMRWTRRSRAQVHISTDARFPNEIDALRDEFGKVLVVKLHRKGTPQENSGGNHVSEQIEDLEADIEFHAALGDHEALRNAAKLVSSEATRWLRINSLAST